MRIEVLVADVASADDRDLAVDRERLVVHAPIEAREVGQEFERSQATQAKRIEQPHFDVRMRGERTEESIETRGVIVVEQETDTNAAVGGPTHRCKEQHAGHVLAPDVVLDVERVLGLVGKEHAGRECVPAVAQLDDAGLPGM